MVEGFGLMRFPPSAHMIIMHQPPLPFHPTRVCLGQAANIYGGFLQRRLQESTDDALKALDAVRSLRRLQLGPSDSTAEDADVGVRTY